jgi:uracil-DNA glycosylase
MSARTLLAAVASEVAICVKCPLCRSRKNAVPGEGDLRAKAFFVGEAPGNSEDAAGRPFIGAAGKFLEELLEQIGSKRKNLFITNVVKCRPPKNRKPHQLEIQTCTPYLLRQIKIIKPRIIVTLGSTAAEYLLPEGGLPFSSITQVHGHFYKGQLAGQKVTIFATFHPAAVLRGGQYKEEIVADFARLKRELEK